MHRAVLNTVLYDVIQYEILLKHTSPEVHHKTYFNKDICISTSNIITAAMIQNINNMFMLPASVCFSVSPTGWLASCWMDTCTVLATDSPSPFLPHPRCD